MRKIKFRWPWMTKTSHELITSALLKRLDAAIAAITTERQRATQDGTAKVHRFMVEANAAVFGLEGSAMYVPRVRAIFQQAEREFRPTPLTLSEHLHGPADIKEALNAAKADAR